MPFSWFERKYKPPVPEALKIPWLKEQQVLNIFRALASENPSSLRTGARFLPGTTFIPQRFPVGTVFREEVSFGDGETDRAWTWWCLAVYSKGVDIIRMIALHYPYAKKIILPEQKGRDAMKTMLFDFHLQKKNQELAFLVGEKSIRSSWLEYAKFDAIAVQNHFHPETSVQIDVIRTDHLLT